MHPSRGSLQDAGGSWFSPINVLVLAAIVPYSELRGGRLKFPNWGSNASDDADALFWEEGYLTEDQAGDSENIRLDSLSFAAS